MRSVRRRCVGKRLCLGRCGRVVAGSYCGKCEPRAKNAHWSKGRDRQAQRRFREVLMARADGRCEFTEDGARCIETRGLQAHHTEPGNDDPATGLLLCRTHHRAVDPHAR